MASFHSFQGQEIFESIPLSYLLLPTMAFNAATLDAFFLNGPQMGLTAAQRQRLASEGLVTVHDFEDFDEKQLDLAMKNLRTSRVFKYGLGSHSPTTSPLSSRDLYFTDADFSSSP